MSQQGPNLNFSESTVSLTDIPNEVQRIILFSLSSLQRKAITRVQRLWQFLDASITPEEQKTLPIEEQLLKAAEEGNLDALKASLSLLKNEIKMPNWTFNESIWLALRLAAKNSHFECMAPLFEVYDFNYPTLTLYSRPDSPYFFEDIEQKRPIEFFITEQKRISENIDAMPKYGQLKTIKPLLPEGDLLRTSKQLFRILQIFIANDQADYMRYLFQERNVFSLHNLPVLKAFLFFMVNHNRVKCLKSFLEMYGYHMGGDKEIRRETLQQLIEIAAKAGYTESLKALLCAAKNRDGSFILPWAYEIALIAAAENNQENCINLLKEMREYSDYEQQKEEEDLSKKQGALLFSDNSNKRKSEEESNENASEKQKLKDKNTNNPDDTTNQSSNNNNNSWRCSIS